MATEAMVCIPGLFAKKVVGQNSIVLYFAVSYQVQCHEYFLFVHIIFYLRIILNARWHNFM